MDVEQAMLYANRTVSQVRDPQALEVVRTLAAEVRRLSGSVPAGCVRDEAGADVPFVGTLPRTADNVIVGHGATIHHPVRFRCNDKNHTLVEGPSFTMVLAEDVDADRDATRPPFVSWGGPQHDCAGIEECYSTRAAAEAARAGDDLQAATARHVARSAESVAKIPPENRTILSASEAAARERGGT